MTLSNDQRVALIQLLGARLSERQADRDHHAGTEAHHDPAPPDAVAWPETTEEVAAIMRVCNAHQIAVIPHGAGSSLEGNTSALRGGLCIDLSRMDRILDVRPTILIAQSRPV